MSTARTQQHIAGLVLSILTAAAGVYGVYSFVQYLQQEESVVLAAHQRIASYSQNKKIFADEFAAMNTLTTRVTTLESYTITPASIPTLLSSLEDTARARSITFDITSAQTPGKQKTEKLSVDFAASGDIGALTAFLDDVSHQTYQLKFTKLSLFADGTTPGKWSMIGSVQIMSFGI
jgi:Tfp pilus assembly protein PilO